MSRIVRRPSFIETLESRQLLSLPAHAVRVAYLIPTNRVANPDSILGLRNAVSRIASFYSEQLARHGLAGALQYETEADNLTPKINVVNVPQTDAFLRADDAGNSGNTMYDRINTAAEAAGYPVFSEGKILFLVAEMHLLKPDGTLIDGPYLGAGFGSGSGGGVAHLGSAALPFLTENGLNDTRPYAGLTLPSIGATPLVNQTSFFWFEGQTISQVMESRLGGIAHEAGHAIGLPHDFRNDNNSNGDLMGNGLRGIGGASAPAFFPGHSSWLSRGHALQVSASRFLQPPRTYTDNTEPNVSISSAGSIAPTADGRVRIGFSTSDASGVVVATLSRNGDTVGELQLNLATTFTGFIETPYYDLGNAEYKITVVDGQGNKRDAAVNLNVNGIGNRAPRPFASISATTLRIGSNLTLSASQSSDPESNTLLYQWDLNGDEVFDTPLIPGPTFITSFPNAGVRRIAVRVVDSAGGSAESSPIPIRIVDDSIPPTLLTTLFNFQSGKDLTLFFSEDIGSTLATTDLTLSNFTTGQTLSPVNYMISRDGQSVTIRSNTLLADGNWRATIATNSISDGIGNTNDFPLTGTFYVLSGDANRDRAVNFDDLLILSQNYNQPGRTFSQGNFDYSADGLVNFDDLLVVAQRYGTSLFGSVRVRGSSRRSSIAADVF